MIDFFRKTRKKLGDDNKLFKYSRYAIGEILLVMVGILLALQVNNWNEERKDRIKEKEVLQAILINLDRNNNLIRESFLLLDDFDKSSEIVLETLRNDAPYSDTLAKHFFPSTRTGGLLLPLSSEGYESLKNEGFDIIHSKLLKNRILKLFEVTYGRIKTKAEWTMFSTNLHQVYLNSLFRQEIGEVLIPANFDQLTKDNQFYSILMNIKESKRGFLKKDIIKCLHESEQVIKLIKDESI